MPATHRLPSLFCAFPHSSPRDSIRFRWNHPTTSAYIPALKDLPPSYLTGPEWRNRRTMIHRRFTFVVLPSASVILIVAPDLLLTVTFSFLLCNPCPAPHFDYHYKHFIKEIREAVPVMQAFMNLLLLCFRESQIKKLLGLYLSLHTA